MPAGPNGRGRCPLAVGSRGPSPTARCRHVPPLDHLQGALVAALLPAPLPHDPSASSPVTAGEIDSLVASVSGTVIRPEDAAFDEARQVHNTLIDRKPTLIVRAADAADVARAVTFAREHGLELAVRAGGHSIHSATDGGLVIDLSAMKGLHIDPERRLAWAQP